MAIDRRATGFVVLRVALGDFFIFQAMGKYHWVTDGSILSGQLDLWLQNAAPGSISHSYLQRVALPFAWVFSRLVPLGEVVCGIALVIGFMTPAAAFVAFLMVLNYQIASGTIFEWSFLANRSVMPVLASTLALAIGGGRLPWSLRL